MFPLAADSIPRVVDIHVQAFPSFFLSRLGPRVLRLFYEGFLGRDDVVAIQAVMNGRVVGVAVGPMRPDGFFKDLIRRDLIRFGFASLGFMCSHPLEISRVLRAVRYRGGSSRGEGALLSSIAVAPEYQGLGIGVALLHGWEEAARGHGCVGAQLTTDLEKNEATIEFYLRHGWQKTGSFQTREGRKMLMLSRHFDQPEMEDSGG